MIPPDPPQIKPDVSPARGAAGAKRLPRNFGFWMTGGLALCYNNRLDIPIRAENVLS